MTILVSNNSGGFSPLSFCLCSGDQTRTERPRSYFQRESPQSGWTRTRTGMTLSGWRLTATIERDVCVCLGVGVCAGVFALVSLRVGPGTMRWRRRRKKRKRRRRLTTMMSWIGRSLWFGVKRGRGGISWLFTMEFMHRFDRWRHLISRIVTEFSVMEFSDWNGNEKINLRLLTNVISDTSVNFAVQLVW